MCGKVSSQAAGAPSDVLKIHVVRPGGHGYYVDDLVPGRAEGTGVGGEAPGTWAGAGTGELGVTGTVGLREFGEVLDGRDPGSGRALRLPMGARSVSGYDLVFCAPKSVSLLHLLAPRELAHEVGAGHRMAVAEAADYLQRAAVGVRRSRGGRVTRLPTTGVVAGAFVHRTSRALDPHLHTHLVVANVAQGVDGAWSAVDGRGIFDHLRAVRGIYHARLRMELGGRLGVAWDVPRSGMGDVRGVDPRMRHLFSQRSAAIAEYAARHSTGRRGPHPTRGAFYATRPDKDRTRTVESLVGEWKDRAAEFGFEVGDLTRVVGLGRMARPGEEVDAHRVRDRLEALSLDRRTVAHRDVVAVVAGASPGGAPAQLIESVATRVVEAAGAPLSSREDAGGSPRGRVSGVRHPGLFEPRWAIADVARAIGRTEGLLTGLPEVDMVRGPDGREVAEVNARGRDVGAGRTGPDHDGFRAHGNEVVRDPVDHALGR